MTTKSEHIFAELLPILSVTVMMLSDMVDSVIVLNDEHCEGNSYEKEMNLIDTLHN